MKALSIILTSALFASSLSAASMPHKAELLAANSVRAHYLGTQDIPCRHHTADCPDKCNHATRVALFRVWVNENYEKHSEYGDDKMNPGDIVQVDIQKPTPGQDNAAIFAFVARLKPGNTVRFTQAHYYGDFGHAMMLFRPITHIEVEETAASESLPQTR